MQDVTEIMVELREVFEDVFEERVPISSASTAADFENWDSLGNIRLFMAIERKFEIKFRTSEITGLKNVGELAAVIKQKIG